MHFKSFPTGSRREKGFNLIENLVTLLVLTVGLLGIAGMQAVAIQTQQTGHHYGRATSLAQNMAERMRANFEAAEAGDYAVPNTGSVVENSKCFTTEGCSPQQMAETDINEWHQMVERTLPQGDSHICRDSTPSQDPADYIGEVADIRSTCDDTGDTYVIHVFWDMDPTRDGNVELTADPQTTDGHLILVFEP